CGPGALRDYAGLADGTDAEGRDNRIVVNPGPGRPWQYVVAQVVWEWVSLNVCKGWIAGLGACATHAAFGWNDGGIIQCVHFGSSC
ncbi:MAG TPA: hypothetical protein VND19_11785, partial [Acetobacteraceae bacterium]|nr:hypothetical protein [Acetobacteraceae bacterium]